MDSFPLLFAICDNQSLSVANVLQQDSLELHFRRSLDQEGLRQWRELEALMANVSIRTGRDKVSWHLEQPRIYSVKLIYAKLS
jgi:hypothetical protein